ncbi:MAG: NUDIX domain-containing protein [Deltaproteobacteria bacterium]|nr:NUDIX domain-containing protein [Deltaproteobacteria bacterium]
MEFIYVVKRELLGNKLVKTGTMKWNESWGKILDNGFFVERKWAEKDSSFKQIIPYILMKRGNEIFLFRRLKGGGEKRLHNLWSVGIGGHINPGEVTESPEDIFTAAALREINEELVVSGQLSPVRPAFLLNDDSNEVGSVHLGLVMICEVPERTDLSVRETDTLEGEFIEITQLSDKVADGEFESWSSIALKELGVAK